MSYSSVALCVVKNRWDGRPMGDNFIWTPRMHISSSVGIKWMLDSKIGSRQSQSRNSTRKKCDLTVSEQTSVIKVQCVSFCEEAASFVELSKLNTLLHRTFLLISQRDFNL